MANTKQSGCHDFFDAVQELAEAARAVIESWEHGDLAAAVRQSEEALGRLDVAVEECNSTFTAAEQPQTTGHVKSIEWAYPTSEFAKMSNRTKEGAWIVTKTPADFSKGPALLDGFATIEEARAYAASLPYPWSRYTRY